MSKKHGKSLSTVEDGPSPMKVQRWKAAGKDPELEFTNEWLQSTRNALFCAVRPLGDGGMSRSMAFAYDVLPSGHQVLCTARHVFFQNADLSAHRFFRASLTPTISHPVHATPVYAPDDYDLAFVVLPPTVGETKLFNTTHYDQWSPSKEGWLFNTKNSYGEGGYPAAAMRQWVKPRVNPQDRAWCLLEQRDTEILPPDAERVPELRAAGYKEYGYANMRSLPACSGSPVWDPRLRLVGMNLRGERGSDSMAYLFAGDIHRLYEQSRDQIREAIGSSR